MENKMEEQKAPTKVSYEQLENIAHQLSEQNRDLYNKLQEANLANTIQRLRLLFKVVKYKESFDTDFVNNCISEIQEIMTITEETITEEEVKTK